jgi:hypothetical protein
MASWQKVVVGRKAEKREKEKKLGERTQKHGVRSGLSDLTEAKRIHSDQNILNHGTPAILYILALL